MPGVIVPTMESVENSLRLCCPWFSGYRDGQAEIIMEVVEAFESNQVVVLDAPTGSGKTLIAESIRRMLDVQATYVCHTKQLQTQVLSDFTYAQIIRGRSNYPVEKSAENPGVMADDCTGNNADGFGCLWCSHKLQCPYYIAKSDAVRNDLAVANTAFWLSETEYSGEFRNRGMVVFDEADTLENELMGQVEVFVSGSRVKKYRLGTPKITVEDDWVRWCKNAVVQLKKVRLSQSIEDRREAKRLATLIERLVHISYNISNWVYTGNNEYVSFKPIRIDGYGKKRIWGYENKFLLMSATVISAGQLLDDLGWDGDYYWARLDSRFKAENRRVYVQPVGQVIRQNMDNVMPGLVGAVGSIAKRNQSERVLVHCHSYKLAFMLAEDLELDFGDSRQVMLYESSKEKDEVVEKWLRSQNGILLAPSLERGLDLIGDKCRVQVIAKVPYPNMGDRRVARRMFSKGGQLWYDTQTVRSIMQMCGRIVRSEKDWGTTYILDEQFVKIWGKRRELFPPWFRQSVTFGMERN